MVKFLFYFSYLFILESNIFAQDSACIDCSTGSLHACSQQRIEHLQNSLRRSKLIIELSVRQEHQFTPEEVFSSYIRGSNDIRQCQKELGLVQDRCSIPMRFEDSNNERFNIDYNLDFLSQENGECVFHPFNSILIMNRSGEQIANNLNDKWSFNQKVNCSSSIDGNTYSHSRGYVLNDKGALVIDWFNEATNITNPSNVIEDTRVSQNIGRRVEMGNNTRLNVVIDDSLHFNYSNGHSFVLSPRGSLIESSFIDIKSYNESCKTNTWRRSSGSKVYFLPNIILAPSGSQLNITTVNN